MIDLVMLQRVCALAAAAFVLVGATSSAAPPIVVVDRFDTAVQNEMGGYRGTYQRSPSRAKMLRVDDEFRGAGGHSMRVRASKQATGFCGLWVHFFDFRSNNPSYFDAREFAYLSFWVKGKRGGERFNIRLADQRWIEKEDSVAVGHVNNFLAGGVTTQWQQVHVPLRGHKLDLSRLGGLTLDFLFPGESTIFVDDISLKTRMDVDVPQTNVADRALAKSRRRSTAMWLWSTESLLKDRHEWDELFDFCGRRNVDQLWVQLPYAIDTDDEIVSPNDAPRRRCLIQMPGPLRDFLRMAHQRQLDVHALDGAPEYCLKQQHAIPLAIVDAVIQFNRDAHEDERFDGIHFDNEPYLLLAWHCPQRREEILQGFLQLNAECQRRVRENSNMQYGIDIPFWWQARDKTTGKCHGSVAFRGVRKAASYHCIDMLDNVGIMNYRDTADGADGMIAHGRELLAYADRVDRAKVYMGVETFAYKNRPVWFVVGLPRSDFDAVLRRGSLVSHRSRFAGHRIRVFDDGRRVHLGLEIPSQGTDVRLEDSLRQLAAEFGIKHCSRGDDAASSAKLDAQRAIKKNPEWDGFEVRDVPLDGAQRVLPGFVAESIMLSKVTFADDSHADFREQTTAAAKYFGQYKKYDGMAIHFYKTYRSLAENADGPAGP